MAVGCSEFLQDPEDCTVIIIIIIEGLSLLYSKQLKLAING